MNEFFESSSVWGTVLTVACFGACYFLQKKVKKAWCNPLLLSSIIIGACLMLGNIPYSSYKSSSSVLSWLLLPATVSLAIPLFEQWKLLKKNWKAILCGIGAGVITSLLCTVILAKCFGLPVDIAVSMLPKSVTTAIGTDLSAELGGIPSLSIVLIILTGITGNILAPSLCKLLRLRSAVARGVAIGTASHAIGTSKAMEMGDVEGAMSGLAIAVAGILTAVLMPFAVKLL